MTLSENQRLLASVLYRWESLRLFMGKEGSVYTCMSAFVCNVCDHLWSTVVLPVLTSTAFQEILRTDFAFSLITASQGSRFIFHSWDVWGPEKGRLGLQFPEPQPACYLQRCAAAPYTGRWSVLWSGPLSTTAPSIDPKLNFISVSVIYCSGIGSQRTCVLALGSLNVFGFSFSLL